MDSLDFYISNLGPAIVRTIATRTGEDWDVLAGQTFKLRVRARDDSAILLDKTMVPDEVANTLTYQPTALDVPFKTEGTYRAWVYYVNAQQDTDEFEIRVLAHAPGEGKRTGAVWRKARALEPVSWDALRSYSDYGDAELQDAIELAKLRVLPEGTTVTAAGESALDPRVVDYVAKKVLVDNVLSAAISFWTNQVVQQTARGNSEEVVTYPDRIRTAQEAILRYRSDLERQLPEVERVIGVATMATYAAPAVNTVGGLITPGLEHFGDRNRWRRTW